MKTASAPWLFAVAALLAAACGESNGSCAFTVSTHKVCEEFTGSAWTPATVMSACSTGGGTYSASACAMANGSCTFQPGVSTEYRWLPAESADAGSGSSFEAFCAGAGGVFSH
jgi:hypothetical protein